MLNTNKEVESLFSQSIQSTIGAIELSLDINKNISEAISLLSANANKHIIVCALGKSGYIAAKLAATLKSLNISAEYLHAAEALHGDLGSISSESLVILISNSGETEEVVSVAKEASNRGAACLGITAHLQSSLASHCRACFLIPANESVCRLGIAPMSSTTVSLTICDAIANVLSFLHKTDANLFRKNHPGGKLGKLLSPISLVMKPINGELIDKNEFIINVLEKMSGQGFVLVSGSRPNSDIGIFTDGDLRRLLQKDLDIKKLKIGDFSSFNPVSVSMDLQLGEVQTLMTNLKVSSILISDQNNQIIGTYKK